VKTFRSNLCVGGELDGQRHAQPDGQPWFKLMKLFESLEAFMKSSAPWSSDPNASVPIQDIVYVRETFHTAEAKYEFWVPEGQTIHQTMEKLFKGYKP
jgi:hypothetical protein